MNSSIVGILLVGALVADAHAACTTASMAPNNPDSAYRENFNGTVTDTRTGLTWAKCSVGQSWVENSQGDGSDDACSGAPSDLSWKGALDAAISADENTYMGSSGWRLPNVKELESLIERSCSSPAINESIFPETPSGSYWTSSPYADLASNAWLISFSNGSVALEMKDKAYAVRLVRSE